MASDWYYTRPDGQQYGPVSSSALRQLAAAGKLQPTDMVLKEGMENWVLANSIKNLVFKDEAVGAQAPRGPAPAGYDDEEGESSSGGMQNMHPVLVFFLSMCTFGLFGLVYTYRACSKFNQLTEEGSRDDKGRPLGKVRHPAWVLLLSYLTFGFYTYYWAHGVMKDCCAYLGKEEDNPRMETSLMLIVPFYRIYIFVFRLPLYVTEARAAAGLPPADAVNQTYLFLLPILWPVLPLLGMLYQDALNPIWIGKR